MMTEMQTVIVGRSMFSDDVVYVEVPVNAADAQFDARRLNDADSDAISYSVETVTAADLFQMVAEAEVSQRLLVEMQ